MNKYYRYAIMILLIIATVFGLLWAFTSDRAQAGASQEIHFNGQTLDLTDASNVLIQSSESVQYFEPDAQGGAVTVTTSIVTVTVWIKPVDK